MIASSLVSTALATASAKRDYEEQDRLSARTQVLMWPAYLLGAAVIVSTASEAKNAGTRASKIAGAGLAAAGLGLLVAGARPFQSLSQLAGRESGELITSGIYGYSRNPQYVGNVLLATGAAVAARSVPASLLALGTAAAYASYVPAEEAHLERAFGDDYANYKQKTSRWLGVPD